MARIRKGLADMENEQNIEAVEEIANEARAEAAEERVRALEAGMRLILTGEFTTPPGWPGSFEIARRALQPAEQRASEGQE